MQSLIFKHGEDIFGSISLLMKYQYGYGSDGNKNIVEDVFKMMRQIWNHCLVFGHFRSAKYDDKNGSMYNRNRQYLVES